MDVILLIFLIVTLSFFLVKIFDSINLPRVLAPLFVGVVFGYFKDILNIVHGEVLSSLAHLGIIMLLFYIGLELNIKDTKKQGKQTILVALLGFVFTFTAGFGFSFYFLDLSLLTSFIVASVLSITAEGIVVMLLEESRLLKSKMGEITIGAGIIDDLIGIFLLAITVFMIGFSEITLLSFIPIIVGVGVFAFGYIYRKNVEKIIDDIFVKKNIINSYDLFTYSLIFLLALAVFTNIIGLDFSIGAIIAGLLLNISLMKKGKIGKLEESRIDAFTKNISFGFLSYFFFFWIGFNFDINSLLNNNMYLGVMFAAIAFSMKYFASLLASFISKDTFYHGSLIGIGMSSKGGVELIIAEIARNSGLISIEIFSALVFMSIILTIISPIAFNWEVKNKRLNKK